VYACLQVETPCPVGQTDTNERVHRVVVDTAGEWNVGDTIHIKLGPPATNCRIFGFQESGTGSTDVIVVTHQRQVISSTVTNLGTVEATITLTASAPAGITLDICYRVGLPATYDSLGRGRGQQGLNRHNVTLDASAPYSEVYGTTHPWLGDPDVTAVKRLVGRGMQTNPPV
jgi:hypothetical protein